MSDLADVMGELLAVVDDVMWNGYAWIGLSPCVCCGGEKPRHRDGCDLAFTLSRIEQIVGNGKP